LTEKEAKHQATQRDNVTEHEFVVASGASGAWRGQPSRSGSGGFGFGSFLFALHFLHFFQVFQVFDHSIDPAFLLGVGTAGKETALFVALVLLLRISHSKLEEEEEEEEQYKKTGKE
jgi:hypothetical protein